MRKTPKLTNRKADAGSVVEMGVFLLGTTEASKDTGIGVDTKIEGEDTESSVLVIEDASPVHEKLQAPGTQDRKSVV